MDTAFILLKTEPAREKDVYSALLDIAEVIETHALYGEYDLLARVECANSKELTSILMKKLRQIDGIRETETLIAVDY
ncbi:MAG: Lrp/AsnC ligand binding domain-containing protein [Euryarchaeota archaeon]|jgi:DNA-binding Lrp family transcriptional regulator|nr:Lrp/AsnC ligand binding domain-containing protein [Euryarchaeota archaeon]